MATNYTNTLDGLLLLNDANMKDIYPNQVLDSAPVIQRAYAMPASQGGTTHKYVRRYTAAGAGFRAVGTGVTNAAEVFEDVTINCKFLDPSFERDVAQAAGFRGGLSGYIKKETLAALRAGFAAMERALFANVSSAFAGLLQFNDYAVTGGTQVVNAGGAGGKSVWLLRWAEDGVALIAGNEGRIDMLWDDDNPTVVRVACSGGYRSGYLVTLGGWFGLQVGSTYDACRIANLDGTNDDLLDDDLIAQAISTFPADKPPNMIVMNRTAQRELREGRTATNPTGNPAPFPDEAFGIPIVVTDLLPTDETTVGSTTTPTTTSTTSA
jgi:hypothetical protein